MADESRYRKENGEEFSFKRDLCIKCRCGAEVSFGSVDGIPAGIHMEPYCKDFIELDLLDYMRWLRTGERFLS